MKKYIKYLPIVVIFLALLFFVYLAFVARASEVIHENGECSINNSEHFCEEGTECVLFNEQSENGKCTKIESTITPTPVECEGNCEPTATPEVTQEPSATPVPVVEEHRQEPAAGAPPEWANPCYYLKDNPNCLTKQQVFPGEDDQAGVHK